MAQRDSYGRRSRPGFEQDYRYGDGPNGPTWDAGPHVSRRGGPGAYGPFGGSLYAGGGGAFPMTPGYMDWGARTTGSGDRTVPGRGGDDFPGQDTWGEAQYRREAREASGLRAGAGAPRGGHAGRGPRNWRRSDERICEDVNEALTRDPDVDATGIEVSVEHGEVTLKGDVDDRRMKRIAEDVAASVSGVHDVHNRLKVVPSGVTEPE
ncbi:MAG TPA: BON domain-containing protein [Gemmatimonadales bacterium]|nr:BON domain-containing protein [Gemmatimonadales bacterium]